MKNIITLLSTAIVCVSCSSIDPAQQAPTNTYVVTREGIKKTMSFVQAAPFRNSIILKCQGESYYDDQTVITSEGVISISATNIQVSVNGHIKDFEITVATKKCSYVEHTPATVNMTLAWSDIAIGDNVIIFSGLDEKQASNIRKGILWKDMNKLNTSEWFVSEGGHFGPLKQCD